MAKPKKPFWVTMPAHEQRAMWEMWEERAAIIEFEAGYDRETAEKRAYEELCRQYRGL